MRLSPKAINSLKRIFMEEFNVALTDEEAQEEGLKIVKFVFAKEIKKKYKAVSNNGKGI